MAETVMKYDPSLVIEEYKRGTYCMFLRRPDTGICHDIPEEIADENKKVKKDFSPYRRDKKLYNVHEPMKIDDRNFIASGTVTMETIASWLDAKEREEFKVKVREKLSGSDRHFLFEYLKGVTDGTLHKNGDYYDDKYFDYAIVEKKNNFASKVLISIKSKKADGIEILDESVAQKIDWSKKAIWSYEAGYILGTNSENKIYVQFEDTDESKCQIFMTGLELNSVNDYAMKVIELYGDSVE